MSDAIELDPHQNDSVTMALEQPTVLLDHEVGTGKTFTMVATIMEKRRLGQANKPVMVVPNHLLEQAVREFRLLYPDAKILATDSHGLSGDGRKKFVAQAAGGDWDAVIMTATSFKSIPLSESQIADKMQAELDELRAKRDAELDRGRGETAAVKKYAAQILAKEADLKEIQDRLARDRGGLDFESIGFDYLVVDEAHGYKNDEVESDIPGLAKVNANMAAIDLREKLDWLRGDAEARGRTSVAMFATGTPVSNSTREFYVMLRYMRPDLLREAHVEDFDSFAAMFLQVRESIETSVTGKLQVKMREGDELINAGELKRLWVQFVDTTTADDVGLERPSLRGGKAEKSVGQVSDNQRLFLAHLQTRGTGSSRRASPRGRGHVVAIGTDGLIASVDCGSCPITSSSTPASTPTASPSTTRRSPRSVAGSSRVDSPGTWVRGLKADPTLTRSAVACRSCSATGHAQGRRVVRFYQG